MENGQSYASDPMSSRPQDVPTGPPKNFIARIIGTLFSPGETFTEMKWAPGLLIPIIFSIVFGATSGFLMSQRLDMPRMMREKFNEAVADGKMKAEDADAQAKMIGKFSGVQFIVIGALGSLLGSLIIAGIFKLVSMVMGHENNFTSLLAVTLYVFVAVGLVTAVIMHILLRLKDPADITLDNLGNIVASNAGSWVALAMGEKALPKFVMGLLSRIDLFSIWIISLLSIGYAAVTHRMKTGTAATYLIGLYVIYALIASAVGAMFG